MYLPKLSEHALLIFWMGGGGGSATLKCFGNDNDEQMATMTEFSMYRLVFDLNFLGRVYRDLMKNYLASLRWIYICICSATSKQFLGINVF